MVSRLSRHLEELALVEPLSVGFHAADRGRIAAGDTVAVIGCGIVGMGALYAAVLCEAGSLGAAYYDTDTGA